MHINARYYDKIDTKLHNNYRITYFYVGIFNNYFYKVVNVA